MRRAAGAALTLAGLCAACAGPPAIPPPLRPSLQPTPARATADTPAAQYALGKALQATGRDAEAVKAFKRVLQLAPGERDAQNGIAVIYALHGHHALAIDLLRELLARSGESPATAYLLNNLGYTYLLAGRYELAVATLERAAALAPADPATLRNLGRALHAARAGD